MSNAKYLVVSYDPDEQQWFYDVVLATSEEQAEEYICKIRDYVIAADATRPERLNFDLGPGSFDASVPLCECQNCRKVFPEDDLLPIEDLSMRVAAGEPMPAGECPSCRALCQPIKAA